MIRVWPRLIFRGAYFRIRSEEPLPEIVHVLAYGRRLRFAQRDAHNVTVRVPHNWPRRGGNVWPIGTERQPLVLVGRDRDVEIRPPVGGGPLVKVEIRRIGRPLPPGVTRDPTNPYVLHAGPLRCWEELDGNIRCGPKGYPWFVRQA